jgi:hypothetical protein
MVSYCQFRVFSGAGKEKGLARVLLTSLPTGGMITIPFDSAILTCHRPRYPHPISASGRRTMTTVRAVHHHSSPRVRVR